MGTRLPTKDSVHGDRKKVMKGWTEPEKIVFDIFEQFVDTHDLDVEVVLHDRDECVVFLPRPACPDDIIEQELCRI